MSTSFIFRMYYDLDAYNFDLSAYTLPPKYHPHYNEASSNFQYVFQVLHKLFIKEGTIDKSVAGLSKYW